MTTFRGRVLALIDELGPLTHREIAEQMGLSAYAVRCRLGKMRATHPRDLRVCDYVREEIEGHLYPRARYARGPGPNAPRPPPLTNTEYNRRHRRNKAGRVNSVFGLAVPVEKRRQSFHP
jgi:hypothetical protein